MKNKILSKLISVSLLQAMLSVLFLGVTIIGITKATLESHFIDTQGIILRSIRDNVLLTHMDNMKRTLLYFAADPELPLAFQKPEVAERLGRDWALARLMHPSRAWIYYGSRDNRIIVSPRWEADGEYDVRTRPWYVAALEVPGIAWTIPYEEYVTKQAVLTASIAIRDGKGELRGVFAIDTFISEFLQLMELNAKHYNMPVFIADGEGHLLAGNGNDYFDTLEGDSGKLKAIFRARESSYLTASNGSSFLISFTVLDDVGLVLMSAIPKEFIWEEIYPVIRYIHWGTLIGMLAALILSVLTSRYFSGNIVRLNRYIEKIRDDEEELRVCVTGKDEIYGLNTKINQVFGELRAEKKTVDGLVSLVSHNISNRVMAINRQAFRILSGQERSESTIMDYMRAIYDSTNSIGMLVKGMLITRTIKQGPIARLCNDLLDAGELAEMAVARKQDILALKGQRIRIRGETGPLRLRGNENFLLEILDNLIDNASKYSPIGSVMDIFLRRETDWIVFQVADHGPGFRAGEEDRIFEPHARLSAKPTNGEVSNGIGLSVSRDIASQMGAILKLSFLEGYGAVMELRAPAVTQ